jgi:DNA-binding MarR family transcriptional regulator
VFEVDVLAHIGNIPVEEWVPFVAPVVILYLYGRRSRRRRQAEVARLPEAISALDEQTVADVLDAWSEKHGDLSRELLPLVYPPGPDGLTTGELAERVHAEPATVLRQLEELEDLDYLELDDGQAPMERRAWLTFRGHELVEETESALLAARRGEPATDTPRAA